MGRRSQKNQAPFIKQFTISSLMVFVLLVASACNFGPFGHGGSISWVDFIHINGTEYTKIYSAVISDEEFIGEKIGEVKFKVDGNVANPNYRIKDGDAAFHEKGTELFAVEGHHHLLAVPTDHEVNGYQLYMAKGVRGYDWRFTGVLLEKVSKVEIYEGYISNSRLLKKLEGADMEEFIQILSDSEEQRGYMPSREAGDPDLYEIVLYTGEAFAYKYLLQYDGVNYYWYPWETAIISPEIGNYLVDN